MTVISGKGVDTRRSQGVVRPRLAPCPHSPNCVSSRSGRPSQRVEPLACGPSSTEAWETLRKIIPEMKGSAIVIEMDGYFRAEFRTLLGFVDDVEFLLDRAASIIHVRSASRTGYWDFGVNRRRVESIRTRLHERLSRR